MSSEPNLKFKKLYLLMKQNKLFKNMPYIPLFEQNIKSKPSQPSKPSKPSQPSKPSKLGKPSQLNEQSGGYKKGFSLKRQTNDKRIFVLRGYSNGDRIDKSKPADDEIDVVIDKEFKFGKFENKKPQEAAKKIYTRLCKKSKTETNLVAAKSCFSILLHLQEMCCDNLKQDNKERDYYYYIINNPVNKNIKKKNDGRIINVYNDITVIPIFAIRNSRNKKVRMQSVNQAIKNHEEKRNKSIQVYSRRRQSGKRLLKNAK